MFKIMKLVVVITIVVSFCLGGTASAQKTLKVFTDLTPGQPDPNTGVMLHEFENIANEWEKLHPGVKIEFVVQPWTSEQDMRTWHITQLAAGTVPDLMSTQPNWIREDLGKGWWVNLDPYLAEKNPYNPQYETWEDNFYPNLDIWWLVDGHRYTASTTQVQCVLYYNKDIFRELGLGEPNTWSELMEGAKKIKSAGYIPFAWTLSDLNQLTWTSGWFTNFVFGDRFDEFNSNDDEVVSDWELAKTIREGIFTATQPEYLECLRLMKEMSEYWSPGCIGATRPTTYREWVMGEAVIFEDGSWNFYGIDNDPLRDFDYGAFYYPRLTSKASPFIKSDDIPLNNKAAGYGDNMGVPTVTKERGTFDLAIDFFRFFTDPERITALCQEAYRLPNVKGAIGHPLLKDIVPTLGYPLYRWEEEDVWLTIEYGAKYLQMWQDIYMGNLTLDEAAEKMQQDLMIAADNVWEIREKALQK